MRQSSISTILFSTCVSIFALAGCYRAGGNSASDRVSRIHLGRCAE